MVGIPAYFLPPPADVERGIAFAKGPDCGLRLQEHRKHICLAALVEIVFHLDVQLLTD